LEAYCDAEAQSKDHAAWSASSCGSDPRLSVRLPGCYLPIKKRCVWIISQVRQTQRRHTKPPPIWLYSPGRRLIFSLLKRRGLDDFPVPVAHGLAATEHLESLDLLGIAVEVLAFDFL
jgi:hypothetical protein